MATAEKSQSETDDPNAELNRYKNQIQQILTLSQELRILNYANCVVQNDYATSENVKILSIGSATEGLMYASLVGKGLLTAALLGETSPPCSRIILRTIRELDCVGKNRGVYILANAQADLFNLSLALERARQNCLIRVKLLLIGDASQLTKKNVTGDYILVAKLLGAMADTGCIFDDIWDFYCHLINNLLTLPIDYSRNKKDSKLFIHSDLDTAFSQLFSDPANVDCNFILFLNTKKKLSQLEELSLLDEILRVFRRFARIQIVRAYCGEFITSHANFATLTILRMTNMKIIDFLDAPCSAPGWQQVRVFSPTKSLDCNFEISPNLRKIGKQYSERRGPNLTDTQLQTLEMSLEFACSALKSCERQLNNIDMERSQGVMGTRFKAACLQVVKKLKQGTLDLGVPFLFFSKLSVIVETCLDGKLGSIYGLLFEHAAQYFGALPEDMMVGPENWLEALSMGRKAIEEHCNEEQRVHTMFRPISLCESIAKSELMIDSRRWLHAFSCGVSGAEIGAQETKIEGAMHPDPGAHAVGLWMRAALEGVKYKHRF